MATGTREPTRLDFSHVRREVRTALELAIVQIAPTELIESLALVTGLLEALAELPADSPPTIALGPSTVARAHLALDKWRDWSTARKALA